jgi:outer membrane protein
VIGILFVATLGATPIGLDEVRTQSRESNSAAVLAGLTHANTEAQQRLSRSVIYPQLYLSSSANFYDQGPQTLHTTVPVLNPDFSVTYQQENITIPSSNYGLFDTSLNIQQLIYDGGKWWTAIAQAGDQERAALGQLEEQRNTSEYEGVRRFYELVRAEKSAEVLQATAKRSAEQLERARAMFEAGHALKGDVFSAEVTLGNDRISVVRQYGAVTSAQADLAVWLAHPGMEELTARDPGTLDAAPAGAPEASSSLEIARQRRPLLQALSDQVRAAELGILIARSAYLPRLSATAALGRTGPSADPVYTDPTKQNYLSLGLLLHWDLFSGFATDAQVEQARIAKSQADVNLAQAARELEGDVRRVIGNLNLSVDVWKLSVANREAAQHGLSLAEARYSAGAGSQLEIQDAQLKLTQSDLNVVSSRIDIEIARANVSRVLGRPPGATP